MIYLSTFSNYLFFLSIYLTRTNEQYYNIYQFIFNLFSSMYLPIYLFIYVSISLSIYLLYFSISLSRINEQYYNIFLFIYLFNIYQTYISTNLTYLWFSILSIYLFFQSIYFFSIYWLYLSIYQSRLNEKYYNFIINHSLKAMGCQWVSLSVP